MKVNVLIVDDHPLLRSGLRQVLEARPGFALVGEAASGAAALELALERTPDLVVMDVHLPDMSGIEATRRILERLPLTKILVLSGDPQQSLVDAALQAGARGYMLKKSVAEELIQAIESVCSGRLYLCPELNAGVVEQYRRSLRGEAAPPKAVLSDRERQMLRLITEGHRNKEIAAQLQLSANSVETYRSRLMKKLGCSSTAELVRYAIREGIASV